MSMLLQSQDLPQIFATFFLAVWLSLAVWNNVMDPHTNRLLLGQMLGMEQLLSEEKLGRGLLYRRWARDRVGDIVLRAVIFLQVIVCALLWGAAFGQVIGHVGGISPVLSELLFNIALLAFTALWSIFLCGGLYFGYWIKTPQVQQVHFTLLIVALLVWRM